MDTGSYVSCTYDLTTTDNLSKWCVDNNIPFQVDQNSFHTTLLYSENIAQQQDIDNLTNVLNQFQQPIKMKAVDFFLFDSSDGPYSKALVIRLDAPELIKIHNTLINVAGCRHSYDDYVPHITVSYKAPVDFNLDSLTLPTFTFNVLSMKAEPLDLNWTV